MNFKNFIKWRKLIIIIGLKKQQNDISLVVH